MKPTVQNTQIVGVDLGTTNTVIALYDDTGKPKIIPNLDGQMLTPSVVYVGPGEDEILVGTAAQNMFLISPERTFKEFKRDVGTDKVYLEEGDLKVTPQWCQAQVLKYVRQSVIQYTGDNRAASRMVVTVPAYYQEQERQSVIQSIEMAGAEVIQLVNEPTAAGLAHGIIEKQGDRLVLVEDFGGGTLDVSVINYSGGQATVLGSHGDKQLGGKDVDALLLNEVVEAFRKEHRIELTLKAFPGDYFQICEEVIRQKHMLASRNEVKICARANGKNVMVTVTRDRLRELVAPLMARAEKVIAEAIKGAKVNPEEIQHVLLIGGSSRLVPFQELLRGLFGKDRIAGGNVSPDLAVAEGAVIHAIKVVSAEGETVVNESLQAIPAPAITYTDVMPHSLGVAVQDRVSSAQYCSVILERNTPIPCKVSRRYGSVDDRQTGFKVTVVQGEDGQPVKDCLVVGDKNLDLAARKSTEPSIEVTMGYDASGMVLVHVHDLVGGRKEDITIQHYKKN